MRRLDCLPQEFQYTNVFQFNRVVRAVGYDTVTGEKVFCDIDSFDDLNLYRIDRSRDAVFRSLRDDLPLKPISFSSVSDHTDFLRNNGKALAGNLFGEFPVHCRWMIERCGVGDYSPDLKLVKAGFIDIETEISDSFEEPDSARNPVTAVSIIVPKNKTAWLFSLKDTDRALVLQKIMSEPGLCDFDVSLETFSGDEKAMLWRVSDVVCNEESIDILSGWNSDGYDMPYLFTRLNLLFGEDGAKILSPFGHVSLKKKFDASKGRKDFRFYAAGYEHIDYMKAFKKYYGKPLESWTLDFVCQTFLKKGKIQHEGSLKVLYEKHHEEYLFYNLVDAFRVAELDAKFKYLQQMCSIAYDARMNFSDPFSPVRTWENLIYMECKRINKIIDGKHDNDRMRIPGAYVHTPVPGFRLWVSDLDYDSMYPHIHMGWFVSPENMLKTEDVLEFFKDDPKALKTIKEIVILRDGLPNLKADTHWEPEEDEEDEEDDVSVMISKAWDAFILNFEKRVWDLSFLKGTNICLAPSGEFFMKDESAVLPAIMKRKYGFRKAHKNEQIALEAKYEKTKDKKYEEQAVLAYIQQNAEKVTLNSGYGACASPFFRYFDYRIARTITVTGRYMIKTVAAHLNAKLNELLGTTNGDYWCYGDTDSIYFQFEKVLELLQKEFPDGDPVDLLDTFLKEVVSVWIDEHSQISADYFNAEKTMRMKREIIANVSMWRSVKKHYIMNLRDKEGVRYTEPEVHMKGTTFIKTSMPQICRKEFKKFVGKLMELYWEKRDFVYTREGNRVVKGWIDDFKKVFKSSDPKVIASGVSVNNIEKYSDPETMTTTKGAGINVKASVAYNRFIQENGLIQKGYETILSGSKMRYVELVDDNPYNSNAFGFVDRVPEGFDLRYIDHDRMFMKNFGNTVQDLLDDLGIAVDVASEEKDCDDVWS